MYYRKHVGMAFLILGLIALANLLASIYWSVSKPASQEFSRNIICPECGTVVRAGQQCMTCAVREAEAKRKGKTLGHKEAHTTLKLGLLTFVLLTGAAIAWWPQVRPWVWLWRSEQLRFVCPHCRLGMRYTSDQIGRSGPCPGCHAVCELPAPEPENDVPTSLLPGA